MIEFVKRDISFVFQKYKSTVYKCAYTYCKNSFDSNDILQEVFLRYIKVCPVFENEQHQKAWFIRVTINCCKKQVSSSWNKRTEPLGEDIAFEDNEQSELYFAVMALPPKYRIVIHLYYYEDYSIAEIADALGKTYGSTSTMLYRAREQLKKSLTEKGDIYATETIQTNV